MSPGNRSLGAMTRTEIESVLGHPAQLEACNIITDLVEDLRSLESPSDYFEFQRILFGHVWTAQEARAEAARNVKRERRDRPVEEPPFTNWNDELTVWTRIGRQFQSVGDALAWKVFGFDRRFILVLSSNAPPGPMTGKEGLGYELGEVLEIWNTERCFALLHDLTTAIRIADLTKFTERGPRLVEVKARMGRIPAAQMRRMQAAVDSVNEGTPLPGRDNAVLAVSTREFKTHLSELGEGIHHADQNGFGFVSFGNEWIASILSLMSPELPRDAEEGITRLEHEEARHLAEAGFNSVSHRLVSHSIERPGVHPAVAPFTIYPFEAEQCARLVCDYLTFKTTMAWERLARAFAEFGFETECPLPKQSGDVEVDQPVLIAKSQADSVVIPGFALGQLLGELVDPTQFAAAVRELVDQPANWRSGIVTFTNEQAVWR